MRKHLELVIRRSEFAGLFWFTWGWRWNQTRAVGIRCEQKYLLLTPCKNRIPKFNPVCSPFFWIASFALGNHGVNEIMAASAEYYQVLLRGVPYRFGIPHVMRVVRNGFFPANLAFPFFSYEGLEPNILPFARFKVEEPVGVLCFNAHIVLAIYSFCEYVASVYD